ncbi:MAG: hypothetical protein KatS3mg109_0878 [Pirellulaceae bacterium]|nr:MAG: hypothetical protein KatS3mg109_0878 [Pirellulaceae bacterium]GIW94497.1 MAG: hypothetical protein KatS3mg110_2538 [Pirellulaceae bacterium]
MRRYAILGPANPGVLALVIGRQRSTQLRNDDFVLAVERFFKIENVVEIFTAVSVRLFHLPDRDKVIDDIADVTG